MSRVRLVLSVLGGAVLWSGCLGVAHRGPAPPAEETASRLEAELAPVWRRTPQVPPAPQASGREHVLQRGETLWALSRQYGVSMQDIEEINNITNPAGLSVGRTIRIPGPRSSTVELTLREEDLPVVGQVVEDRGTGGIVVAANRGAAVVATASGEVSFVSRSVEGYGRTITVRHSDGDVTFYAGLDTADVNPGQHVEGGERLGDLTDDALLLYRRFRRGRSVPPRERLARGPLD